MNTRKRMLLLLAIMIVIFVITVGTSVGLLYHTAFEEGKRRLEETVLSNARLIESVARFDREHGAAYPGGPAAATLDQIRNAYGRLGIFDNTGEFTLAKREGDQIVFLVADADRHSDEILTVPLRGDLADPMREALSGRDGVLVGRDYLGHRVLAAYSPVGALNLGIVAKINLSEIRAPFLKVGALTGVIGLVLISLGVMLFLRTTNPIIKRLETSMAELKEELEWHRRTEQELRQFTKLLDQSSDAIFVIDPENGRFLRVNEKACKSLGYAAEELLRMKVIDIENVIPDESEWSELVKEISAAGQVILEGEHIRKDGFTFPVEISVKYVREQDAAYMIALSRDISVWKAEQQALEEAREAADAANRAKSEFLSRMSHELRTPLNAVMGMSELLRDTGLTDDQALYVEQSEVASEHLLNIIDNLLDLSSIESGKMKIDHEPFSIRKTMSRTNAMMAVRANEKGLNLRFRVDPEVPDVLMGDAFRLQQVLIGLVENAIKFSEHGEVSVVVERKARPVTAAGAEYPRQTELAFRVTDTGIGIPEDMRKKIFESFTQVDFSDTRVHGGSGLGLSIAQHLVKQMLLPIIPL